MVVAEGVDTVRILTIEIMEPYGVLPPTGTVRLYDSGASGLLLHAECKAGTVERVAQECEAAMWAYVSTGLIGLAAYQASKGDRWVQKSTA